MPTQAKNKVAAQKKVRKFGRRGHDWNQAYLCYLALGPSRTLLQVARVMGAHPNAVSRIAAQDKWAEKVSFDMQKVQEDMRKEACVDLSEMNSRHLNGLQDVQRKALD